MAVAEKMCAYEVWLQRKDASYKRYREERNQANKAVKQLSPQMEDNHKR